MASASSKLTDRSATSSPGSRAVSFHKQRQVCSVIEHILTTKSNSMSDKLANKIVMT